MAKHEITIHENTSATSATAPYLGNYITKSDISFEEIIKLTAKECGFSETHTKSIITGAFEAWEALELEGLVQINTHIGAIRANITGSFPSEDAAFDPTKNALVLTLREPDDISKSLINVVPTIVTDETATKVKLHTLMDLEVKRPYKLIHGSHQFRLQGVNLSMSDTGAAAYFEMEGVQYPIHIDENPDKQNAIGHLATRPTVGGIGKVFVKTRGGDAEGSLQTVFIANVSFLAVPLEPLTITKTTSTSGENKLKAFENFVIHGSGLDIANIRFIQLGCADENGDVSWMNQEAVSYGADRKTINIKGCLLYT